MQYPDYAFLNLPGGFLDGDAIGAGKAQAVRWKYRTMKGSGKRFRDKLADNPNGGDSIGALCDPTGRIMGIMPHPEAFVHYTQHPRWTRENLPPEGDGLAVFRNAYRYVTENL